MSELYHLTRSVRNALNSHPEIKAQLESCHCWRHRQYRAAIDDGGEPPPFMWEDHMDMSLGDLVRASCCPAVEEPMLCCEVGDSKPPSVIPWKCTHGGTEGSAGLEKCNQCGITKKLGLLDGCPVLSQNKTKVKVKYWAMAVRKINEDGTVKTDQIELTEDRKELGWVVERLAKLLETCRQHNNKTRWLYLVKQIDLKTLDPSSLLKSAAEI